MGEIVPLFNFKIEELLAFVAVLIRYSVLFSVLPFIGDHMIPGPIKVLTAFAVTIALFPTLVASGRINPGDTLGWATSASGMIGTLAIEVIFALALGFAARLTFEGISFGANLVGNFMGFASASTFDPHQESQTQIIAQIHTALAMLIFLALDGHHLMLRASLDSYKIVGLGKASFSSSLSQRLIQMSGDTILIGIQISAPIAISLFSVNIVFGVLSKAMPQLNIFVLSFAISALVGFIVMFLSMPEFQGTASAILGRIGDWMESVMIAMARRT